MKESAKDCSCHCCSCQETAAATVVPTPEDPMRLVEQTLYVQGLDCADCAAKVELGIRKMPGVHAAQLTFATGKLKVHFDDTIVQLAELVQAVSNFGYSVEAANPGLQSRAAGDRRPWWKSMRSAATALASLLLVILTGLEWSGQAKEGMLLGYWAVLLLGGYQTAKSGFYSLKGLTFDMNFLMTIAVIGAVAIGAWDEAATVVVLFALGNTLQAYTVDKTRASIRALMELAPIEATVLREGREERLPVADIQLHDILLVKPGERIAMDGIIRYGFSGINQAAITGESMPVEKQTGDAVFAGTINGEGSLEIEVTQLTQDSTLAKILHLVEEAQAQKAPSQQFVDTFAKYYTPAVIGLALAVAVVPWLFFQQSFDVWFYRALVLLVIACPCALVLSTPVSIVSAIGNASRQGVLIKGGAHLEQMGQIKALAFDKTGTLTQGKPVVTDFQTLTDSLGEVQLLTLAAALERRSEHPIAQAILQKAAGLELPEAENFRALLGKGVQGDILGQTVYAGNLRLFEELGIETSSIQKIGEQIEDQGKTVMFVGNGNQVYGLIAVADLVRPAAKQAIRDLKSSGVQEIAMLTGDNRRVAENVAAQLEVTTVYSKLLPHEKVDTVKQLRQNHGAVAMVGDGVNDAPALALADVGIAMGAAGTDAALETADIALLADDLSKLSFVVKLSRKTVRVIKENIGFSIVIKSVFLVLTLAGFANLWLAVMADTGAALLVTLNGMRLMREIK